MCVCVYKLFKERLFLTTVISRILRIFNGRFVKIRTTRKIVGGRTTQTNEIVIVARIMLVP